MTCNDEEKDTLIGPTLPPRLERERSTPRWNYAEREIIRVLMDYLVDYDHNTMEQLKGITLRELFYRSEKHGLKIFWSIWSEAKLGQRI
jgi:hypothetical protein